VNTLGDPKEPVVYAPVDTTQRRFLPSDPGLHLMSPSGYQKEFDRFLELFLADNGCMIDECEIVPYRDPRHGLTVSVRWVIWALYHAVNR